MTDSYAPTPSVLDTLPTYRTFEAVVRAEAAVFYEARDDAFRTAAGLHRFTWYYDHPTAGDLGCGHRYHAVH